MSIESALFLSRVLFGQQPTNCCALRISRKKELLREGKIAC